MNPWIPWPILHPNKNRTPGSYTAFQTFFPWLTEDLTAGKAELRGRQEVRVFFQWFSDFMLLQRTWLGKPRYLQLSNYILIILKQTETNKHYYRSKLNSILLLWQCDKSWPYAEFCFKLTYFLFVCLFVLFCDVNSITSCLRAQKMTQAASAFVLAFQINSL